MTALPGLVPFEDSLWGLQVASPPCVLTGSFLCVSVSSFLLLIRAAVRLDQIASSVLPDLTLNTSLKALSTNTITLSGLGVSTSR